MVSTIHLTRTFGKRSSLSYCFVFFFVSFFVFSSCCGTRKTHWATQWWFSIYAQNKMSSVLQVSVSDFCLISTLTLLDFVSATINGFWSEILMLLRVGVCDGGFLYMRCSISLCLSVSLSCLLAVGVGEGGGGTTGETGSLHFSVFVRMWCVRSL